MLELNYAPCFRLLSTGRLQRMSPRELDIRFGSDIRVVCERLKYEGAAAIQLGSTDSSSGFHVEVHTRYDQPDEADRAVADCRFLVGIVIAAFFEFVFVEDLPDLIPFLAQVATIAHASYVAEQAQIDEYNEELAAEAAERELRRDANAEQ